MYLPQEEILCDLAGSKGPKAKDGKSLPPSLYIGHFMKPYFKDRVTGVVSGGGPALIKEVGGGQQAAWEGALICTPVGVGNSWDCPG